MIYLAEFFAAMAIVVLANAILIRARSERKIL